ncbi:MAG: hypothetical protein H0X67_07570 [Acidobacteria bacterium]|nr:hypothetical protein [Acidobacteriota bacterium]
MKLDVLASRLNAERPIVEAEDAGSPVAAHSVVIDLCNHIIGRAVEVGASDVHIECGARGIAVRFRICGVLEPVLTLPAAVSVPIRNRFKILGGADIAIRHRPQDGAFRVKVNSRLIDVRLRRRMLELQQRLAIQVGELRKAIASMTQLRGLLPICAYCKRVRADQDYWQQLESYISAHSDAQFSHGICPECFEKAEFDLEAPSWKGP